jgi:hypothetical protein
LGTQNIKYDDKHGYWSGGSRIALAVLNSWYLQNPHQYPQGQQGQEGKTRGKVRESLSAKGPQINQENVILD